MANTLTSVIPQLLAQGLMALRENAIMPQLVNRAYESKAAEKGSTIDVPIPSAVAAVAVTPAITPPANADSAPTSVPIALNSWYEAPFYLTDKEILEIQSGFIPMQASEAIKSLANQVNTDIMSLYKKFYGVAGTAGTTPFGVDTSPATNVRKVLNKQLAPLGDRRLVLDPDAEGSALNLRALQDQSWRSNASSIINGTISRTMGFDWFMHQLVPSHTKGTGTGYLINGTMTLGSKTLTMDTGTGTHVEGDIITIAGDTQTYVVTAAALTGATTLLIYPGLKAVPADNAAITITNTTGVQNLAFHRDAIAFATRPLQNVEAGLGAITSSTVDAESGLTLRLEVTRQHKQTRWSFDILYGFAVVRRELGARLLG